MNREQIETELDKNNTEISKLQDRLKACLRKDRQLNSQLSSQPVSYTSNENVEQEWDNEGGRMPDTLEADWIGRSHAKMSPFVSRRPSFNEFAERLTHSDVPPYRENE